MLSGIARWITDKLLGNCLVAEKDKIPTQYGMELLIVYTVNILSAVILGFAIRMPLETLLMLAAFIKLRGYNGGVHAANYFLCYLISMLTIYLSLHLVSWAASLPIHPYFSALILFPFGGLVLFLSPVEDRNKPLDALERTAYRERGLAVLAITLAVSLSCLMLGLTTYGYAIGMAIIVTALSMGIGCIKNMYWN